MTLRQAAGLRPTPLSQRDGLVVSTYRDRVWGDLRAPEVIALDIGAETANGGVMDRTYAGDGGADPSAVPGLDLDHASEPGLADTTLEVDGDVFTLRPDEHGGTGYTWLTGPNGGYGFGTSPTPNWSMDAHRENVRLFLAQIDPATGYLEDT